ncbi:DUF6188 family protein [Micromonospora sp. WMMD1102]|uniref:DUF6188 family protein n=1 Tax=Micromonospora sp. WMMD1102 TaxID=3016105 RepID=UPI0024157EFA|nr:DUF6188 family protein [Micromonospora sp. WMMD1102]MDG4788965.1 DUF6188 family protein [Micromonospora sp. WMMD1102]
MTAPPPVPTEHDDRWILPFRGLVVTRIRVGSAFGLDLGEVAGVRISNVARLGWVNLADRPDEVRLDPEHQDVAAGLVLFGSTVLSAVAFKSGGLRLVFGDGHLLRVAPHPGRAAWTATGPDRTLVTSMPGGDLAVRRDFRAT